MSERRLFDDVSRIVASTMPRRRALRLLIGVLAGGQLVLQRPRRARADDECHEHDHDHTVQCAPHKFCRTGQTCCSDGSGHFRCCESDEKCCNGKCCDGTCCGNKCCGPREQCVTDKHGKMKCEKVKTSKHKPDHDDDDDDDDRRR